MGTLWAHMGTIGCIVLTPISAIGPKELINLQTGHVVGVTDNWNILSG